MARCPRARRSTRCPTRRWSKLRTFTKLSVVADPSAWDDYKLEIDPFPGFWRAAMSSLGERVDWSAPLPNDPGIA